MVFECNFSSNLRNLRLCAGLSQERLADLCGFNRFLICRYENGIYFPSLENFVILCSFFGVTMDDMFFSLFPPPSDGRQRIKLKKGVVSWPVKNVQENSVL